MSLTGTVSENFVVKIQMAEDPNGTATVKFSATSQQVIISNPTLMFDSGDFNVDKDLTLKVNSVGSFVLNFTVETSWSNGKKREGSFIVTITEETGLTIIPVLTDQCYGIPNIDSSRNLTTDKMGFQRVGAIGKPDTDFIDFDNDYGITHRSPTWTLIDTPGDYGNPSEYPPPDDSSVLAIPSDMYPDSTPTLPVNDKLNDSPSLMYKSYQREVFVSSGGGSLSWQGFETSIHSGGYVGSILKGLSQLVSYPNPANPFKLRLTINGVIYCSAVDLQTTTVNGSIQGSPYTYTNKHSGDAYIDLCLIDPTTGEVLLVIAGGISLGPEIMDGPSIIGQRLFFDDSTFDLDLNTVPTALLEGDVALGIVVSGVTIPIDIPPEWADLSIFDHFSGASTIRVTKTNSIAISAGSTLSLAATSPVFDYNSQTVIGYPTTTPNTLVTFSIVAVETEDPSPCRPIIPVTIGDALYEDVSFESDGWHDVYSEGDPLYIIHYAVTMNDYNRLRLEPKTSTSTPHQTGTVRFKIYSDSDFSNLLHIENVAINSFYEYEVTPAVSTLYVTVETYPSVTPTPTNALINLKFNYALGAHPSNPILLAEDATSSNIFQTQFDPNFKAYVEWSPTAAADYDLQTHLGIGADTDTILRYYGTDDTYSSQIASDDDSGDSPAYSLLAGLTPASLVATNYVVIENKDATHDTGKAVKIQSNPLCAYQGNGPGESVSNPKVLSATLSNINGGYYDTTDPDDAVAAGGDPIYVKITIDDDFQSGYSEISYEFGITYGNQFSIEDYGTDSTYTSLDATFGPNNSFIAVTDNPPPSYLTNRYFKLVPSTEWDCDRTLSYGLSGTESSSFNCNGPGNGAGSEWNINVYSSEFGFCEIDGETLDPFDALCAIDDTLYVAMTIQDDPSGYPGDLYLSFEDYNNFIDLRVEYYGTDGGYSSLVTTDSGSNPTIQINQGSISQFDTLYFKIKPDPFGTQQWDQAGTAIHACSDSF